MNEEMDEKLEDKCDPREVAGRWQLEIHAAQKSVKKWHNQGDKIVKRFLDERSDGYTNGQRLNLFSSNVQMLRSMLYGQMPSVDVKRRYADANDDVARVSAEIMDRLLNSDIEQEGQSYDEALTNALSDRLLPGLSVARVRYEAEFESTEVAAQVGENGVVLAEGFTEDTKVFEDAVVDYVYWKDFLWSEARTWNEVRWVAFRNYMTRKEVRGRFGEYYANNLQYKTAKQSSSADDKHDPTERAEVWEIWCKESRQVFWWSEGCERILDVKDDPLGLKAFFPCPEPIFANVTTTSLMPRPDFIFAQDQYNLVDELEQRIYMLQKAIKAVGVYDKSSDGIQRMMNEAFENDLIPVDNWAMFSEKGGINGQVAWMPIDPFVNAIAQLRQEQDKAKQEIYEVTGMSDIIRGQGATPNVTATEQGIKARFASSRLRAMQYRFGEFAADIQRLKAEVIINHFDDETIVQRSAMQYGYDMQLLPQALELLRDDFASYRITIDSEMMAQTDAAEQQGERVQFLDGMTKFITAAAPLAQTAPMAMPFLLEMLKWSVSPMKGSQQIEGVLDQMIQKAQQAAENPQQEPNPEQQKAQMKAAELQMKQQGEMQKIQAKSQAEQQKLYAQTQADMMKAQAETEQIAAREAANAQYNIMEERAKARIRAAEKVIGNGAA